jgi:GTP-binding protein EngB required for normal cell division
MSPLFSAVRVGYAAPVRLADVIGRFLGKVEIVLAGADEDLRAGQEALAAGDAMGARAAAHRVLTQAPDSPLGLALLADACEAARLDAELALTLEELASRAPSRAEVWVRLARARQATGTPVEEVRDAYVRGLAVAEAGSDSRVDALLGLADLDLAQGDGARAELWIERAAPTVMGPRRLEPAAGGTTPAGERTVDLAVRAAEARLLRGDPGGAKVSLDGVSVPATDGRAALARGRTLALLGDPGAFAFLIRSVVLDTPAASEALSSALAHVPSDVQTRTRVRSVVDAKGEQGLARWRAAFARAEGSRDAARRALREAVASGDRASARPLLDAALEDRDADALGEALGALGGGDPQGADPKVGPSDDAEALLADARRIAAALTTPGAGNPLDGTGAALDLVLPVVHSRVVPWAEAVARQVVGTWIPSSGAPASWAPLLARLDARAHTVGDLAVAARVGDLAADRSRPVRLAIVGEFNAGKSTFINALIGADVAPTGVLPTTATLHHLRWAPDPFAKILFVEGHDPRERIVSHGDLRAALKTLDPASIARVELRLPLASLVSVEILDTPGFNAPDPRHARVARSAFDEADAALWLLDATQAMKQSELDVLEEARRAELPVQMLVNKADRLSASDLAKVMASVVAALDATRVGSWGRPLALSAKKALAVKLGAAGASSREALAESGWPPVQALLEDQIVGRSAELKERALRRRAAALVAELEGAWAARDRGDREDAEQRIAAAHAAARAATRVERDADGLADRLAASLTPQAAAWTRDLELVFIGRDPELAARDPVLARYRVDRAVAAFAPSLSRALSAIVPEVELPPGRLAPSARAVVRAAAWSAADDAGALLSATARAAVATLIEQLLTLSVPTAQAAGAAGVLRELGAIRVALASAPGARAEPPPAGTAPTPWVEPPPGHPSL